MLLEAVPSLLRLQPPGRCYYRRLCSLPAPIHMGSSPLVRVSDHPLLLLIRPALLRIQPVHHGFRSETFDNTSQASTCIFELDRVAASQISKTPHIARVAMGDAISRISVEKPTVSIQIFSSPGIQAIYKRHLPEMTSRVPAGPPVLSLLYTPGSTSAAYSSPCSPSCSWVWWP